MKAATEAIAVVRDRLEREDLSNQLIHATHGRHSAQSIRAEVGEQSEEHRQRSEVCAREAELAEQQTRQLDLPRLVDNLENFIGERSHLPEGGALILTHFALHTHVFQMFNATPYVCFESAVPESGKNTVMVVLASLCAKSKGPYVSTGGNVVKQSSRFAEQHGHVLCL